MFNQTFDLKPYSYRLFPQSTSLSLFFLLGNEWLSQLYVSHFILHVVEMHLLMYLYIQLFIVSVFIKQLPLANAQKKRHIYFIDLFSEHSTHKHE